jgi:predicted enzyme related to lactoylglutathione lyase
VTEHGGTLLMPPGDVGPMGRMAIAADPSGAVFGIWQAGEMIGAALVNEPGAMTWEDLRSTDPAKAQDFYRALFGYRLDPVEMAGPDYGTFSLPDEQAPLGGMGPMMGNPEGTPSHWLVYFGVGSTDAAVDAAQAAGGSVLMPAMDSPFGRLAVVADPAGAGFCVIETDANRQPDRAG